MSLWYCFQTLSLVLCWFFLECVEMLLTEISQRHGRVLLACFFCCCDGVYIKYSIYLVNAMAWSCLGSLFLLLVTQSLNSFRTWSASTVPLLWDQGDSVRLCKECAEFWIRMFVVNNNVRIYGWECKYFCIRMHVFLSKNTQTPR